MTDPAPTSNLVLLHGITMSASAWTEVVPHLVDHHRVHTPTALGHRGGRPVTTRPVRFSHILDDCERYLDEHGLDRPHLAGNSMGGWLGIELARRGRAASVCALSPAGFWDAESPTEGRGVLDHLRELARLARRTRWVAPMGMRSAAVRRRAFAAVALRGDRLSPALATELTRDLFGCRVLDDSFDVVEAIGELDVPCPIRIVWGEHDRLFTRDRNGERALPLIPGAEHSTMPGVGHVVMIDDPEASARQILTTTGALSSAD